jgi:hypothetical protein
VRKNFASVFPVPMAVLALALVLTPAAAPDMMNKLTELKFSGPVEFPGRVVVPAGDYVMKLMNSSSNRNIVQVLNADQDHVYATFIAIPAQRFEPTDKTVLTLYETTGTDPAFIHKWFYPGDTFGQEFVYPKDRARYIASVAHTSVPAVDEESGSVTRVTPNEDREVTQEAMNRAPALPGEPAQDNPPPAPPQTAKPAASEPEKSASAPAATKSTPAEGEHLPATASNGPNLALASLVLIAAALMLTLSRTATRKRRAQPSGTQNA